MSAIPAVILAGGLATRMGGGDKALLALGGEPLLRHVIRRLSPQAGLLALNANGDPARFSDFSLPVLADPLAGFLGPLAGVLAAMEWAADLGAKQVVTVAADTPFFPTDLVARLLDAQVCAGADIVLAASMDPDRGPLRQPTFGLWPVALGDDLRAALGDGIRKVVQWSDRHKTVLAPFDIDGGDPFFNINTTDDLIQAQHLLAKGSP